MTGGPERGEITLENWRTHPSSTFSFQNVGEFVPVAEIMPWREPEPATPGAAMLDALRIADTDGGIITATAHLQRSWSDQFVVMRDWQVVGEWLAPHADPDRPHVIFSISKSVTGLLAGIAAEDGLLDPDDEITRYVPSVAGSAYGSARVRDLLDMTVDLDFDEEYQDHGGAFDRYRRAMLWNPEREGTRPETMEAFLGSLGTRGTGHGQRFYYASPNSDLLGLVIQRATGIRYHRYLADRLWRPMGAKGAAQVTVDRVGTARAAGGVCVTARDLARMGQLVMDGGRGSDGRQVVPAAWVADLSSGGSRQAWIDGNFADMFANGRYRSCWYDVGDGRGSIAAVGIHGQWLWIDPVSRIVLAKTSSRPDASDDAATDREIAMLAQIARALQVMS